MKVISVIGPKIVISNSSDEKLSNFIVGYFAVQALNLFIKTIIGGSLVWTVFSRGILAMLLLLALPTVLNRKLTIFVGAEVLLGIAYLFSFLMGEANKSDLTSVAADALAVFLPMGICALCLEDRKKFFLKLYKVAFVGQFLLAFTMYYSVKSLDNNYSMSGGYALLLFLLIVLARWVEKHKWYDLAMSIVDSLAISFLGSRGAIICIAVFIVIITIVNPNIKLRRKAIYFLIIAVIGYIIVFHIQEIAELLLRRIYGSGLTSRTLRLFMQGEFLSHDSGRTVLNEFYFAQIQTRPILGWGILGGRTSMYPHNIAIELLLAFGVIIGSLLFMAIIIVLIRGVTQKNRMNQLIATVFVARIVSLFFSGSVFTCAEFFVCIALCTAQSTVPNTDLYNSGDYVNLQQQSSKLN